LIGKGGFQVERTVLTPGKTLQLHREPAIQLAPLLFRTRCILLTDPAAHVGDDEVVAVCMHLYKTQSHTVPLLMDQSFD